MRLWAIGTIVAAGLGAQEIRTVQVATGLANITDIQNAADGSGRIFLAEQNGVVRTLRNGTLAAAAFLDIRAKTAAGGERGLLGIAFPPGFAQKQRFYVDYTDLNGDTTIAQYRIAPGGEAADPASEVVLLKIPQPFANHNGGQVRFGPDGYLYIGMGDGGSGGDPMNNGQNLGVLLGKILRIDVDTAPGSVRIPPDNPFVNTAGARGEIWAYGLRNPWRFSFDRATRDLWIADVGQDTYEEVDFQPAASRGGENYGWRQMEGMHCYESNCRTQGLTLPIAEYTHAAGGCSITGGFVYRGLQSPGMRGMYFYGDYCSGKIWAVERQSGTWNNRLVLSSNFTITTFGEDEAGEIYLANAGGSNVFRIEGSTAPRLSANGVTNAASFARGMVAGSLATAFAAGIRDAAGVVLADRVPLPATLAGVSVSVGGMAAPLYSVSNVAGQEQVNFQVPFEMAGRPSAPVIVTRDGRPSASVDVPLTPVQPGVYTSDGVQAIAVHATDYSLADAAHPLLPGEYAFVYVSGLGASTNAPATGAGAPSSPAAIASADVRVMIGGVNCDVQFAGLAPGFVGVYQVNFRVAAGLPAGPRDLVLRANGVDSPAVKVVIQ